MLNLKHAALAPRIVRTRRKSVKLVVATNAAYPIKSAITKRMCAYSDALMHVQSEIDNLYQAERCEFGPGEDLYYPGPAALLEGLDIDVPTVHPRHRPAGKKRKWSPQEVEGVRRCLLEAGEILAYLSGALSTLPLRHPAPTALHHAERHRTAVLTQLERL
ncbi:hypothetical protein [Albibacillus kandeliae]|uniref:hypothetical protein n=1 Tax=Albibacillus kandeliae TaxID=2174228 RepID=UPI0013001D49|nr:hypothetical protein [Albibacillus kandeliae]